MAVCLTAVHAVTVRFPPGDVLDEAHRLGARPARHALDMLGQDALEGALVGGAVLRFLRILRLYLRLHHEVDQLLRVGGVR